MKKVFIDGRAGTTGLRIYERLEKRGDIELLTLCEEKRKDISARKDMLNNCDIAFLCLPDAASREAVGLIENPDVCVLDTSTAFRTDLGWAYGFPELSPAHRQKIAGSKRIAVPGCHAGGFIALVYPLVEAGIISKDQLLCCHSLTGYSGGGKSMIAQYESPEPEDELFSPRQYALTQNHKHLKEMAAITGINNAPVFCPIVADYYNGMLVTVPLFKEWLGGAGAEDIKKIYAQKYTGPVVRYKDDPQEDGFICSNKLSFKDNMEIYAAGNNDRILLMARFDNLGKGASGAAVQNMNIIMGIDETTGLDTGE